MMAPSPPTERLPRAKAFIEEALRKNPNSIGAKMAMAAYHVEVVAELIVSDFKPHIEASFKLLEDVLAREPRSPDAHYWLGRTQRHNGDFEAALRSFARVIELNPSHTRAYAQIGLTLHFMRRSTEALEHIRYAIRLSPKDGANRFWLRFAAEAQLDLGRYAEAIEHIERSIATGPKILRAWGVLAAAQALSGDATGARASVAVIRKLATDSTDEELLSRIGRTARIGPNRLHDGLKLALEMAPLPATATR